MKTFGRVIEIGFRNKRTNATIDPSGTLNIGFTIERNLDLEPSTMLATIHNLSKETQESLKDAASGWEASLLAGYGGADPDVDFISGGTNVIFKGDVRFVKHRREPPLLATDIEADDGGDAATKFVTRHFPAGTTVGKVFGWLQEQSTLGSGNHTRITQNILPTGLPDRLKSGTTIKGYAMEEMGDIAKSRGYIVSSQGNEVIVLKPGEPLAGVPVTQISAKTGLIGYPYVDNEGIMTLNHRMLPNVFPGAPVEVKSEFVNGRFVVERAVYSGSLWEDDFNIEIEGRQMEP